MYQKVKVMDKSQKKLILNTYLQTQELEEQIDDVSIKETKNKIKEKTKKFIEQEDQMKKQISELKIIITYLKDKQDIKLLNNLTNL